MGITMLPPETRPCPTCHQPMERGYFETTGRQVGFFSSPPRLARLATDYKIWTPIEYGRAFLPGLHCPECQHVELDYHPLKSTDGKYEPVMEDEPEL
jgi:hypothetical protein